MNKQPILESIDRDVIERLVSRRDAIKKSASASGFLAASLALGSVPVALGAFAGEAFGKSSRYSASRDIITDALSFALLLENLEAEFYKAVLGVSASTAFNLAFAPVRATVTATEQATLDQIRKHEVAHVAFLRTTLTSLGVTPATYAPEAFDFTGARGAGNGPFLAATNNKPFLLAAAQAFEDTGVRAYKGQAGNLITNNGVLEAALRIHSVEARHAAKIRKMRNAGGASVNASGTITGRQSGITGVPAPGQAVVDSIYAGATPEDNVMHTVFNGTAAATLNASTLPQVGSFGGVNAATEAFDEPLTRAEVVAIVQPFVVADIS